MRALDLRALGPHDTDFAWSIETGPRARTCGRLAGRVTSSLEFEQLLWQSVYTQFVVRDGVRDIGIAALRDADLMNGVTSAYVLVDDSSPEVSASAKAALFDRAFDEMPFRKIYDESPDVEIDAPEERVLSERILPCRREGLLFAHHRRGESFAHKPVLSVSRADWEVFRATGEVKCGPVVNAWFQSPDALPSAPLAAAPAMSGSLHRPLTGKRVVLRPVTLSDYESLRVAELSPELGPRWRHRGGTPSPDAFAQGLTAGALAQFLVIERREGRPMGIVSAYSADPLNQHARISVARLPFAEPRRYVLEGMLLFLDYVFACWPFRKLYADTLEFNWQQFASGSGRALRTEARLIERAYFADRYWDVIIVAIDRTRWAAYGDKLLRVVAEEDS